MGLATEYEIIQEGTEAFRKGEHSNPYLQNTWAYKAWNDGYSQAARQSRKQSQS